MVHGGGVAARQRFAGLRQPWQSSHALLAVPLVLIVVITVVDLLVPADVHLGPLLVIAPAITASFAGPRLTGVIGGLTVAAQAFIGWHFGVLFSRNVMVQILALTVLSCLIVCFCVVRERRRKELDQVRTVAEAAQHVLLWPLPEQLGPLQVACLYLAAEDEAQIGGDLYAATRIDGGARVMIGDVRGKGLAAIGEAALLLGAFREAAHKHTTLPELAAGLEQSVTHYLPEFEPEEEAGERFVTTLLLEIPDADPLTRMTSCGHPPPLLLHPGEAVAVPVHPAPPLGVGPTGPEDYTLDVFSFEPGDTLLLYTDGVIEARDPHGAFYPFTQRAAQWTDHSPESLLHHLRRDLLAHVGGRLADDAALIAIRRTLPAHPGRRHRRTFHADGFRHRSQTEPPSR
ncbi:serine/threonine-protein phosphatase [Streptomyces inhibens]|uniref:Serine/threonine-protein phosphatase n=1 Tax=Streptomyces inhibens TaxID=2293571 RepID=A0A371PWU9_STRIH|nr:PP2C family protein-serine/threonine phosphatase [Streptomyces inhibens]REK86954.1 serine/threonine-protein phosphatase [Streptomyces inhibens]